MSLCVEVFFIKNSADTPEKRESVLMPEMPTPHAKLIFCWFAFEIMVLWFQKCIFFFIFMQKHVVDDPMATLLRVSTDNLYKKQLINVWASLGARRIFLQDTPSSAPRGVCSDMPGIHELKMSENVPYWHRMHSNRSSFTFMHSYASSWKRSWRIFLVFTG